MDAWIRYVFVGAGFDGLDEYAAEEAIKVQIMLFILSASKIKKSMVSVLKFLTLFLFWSQIKC